MVSPETEREPDFGVGCLRDGLREVRIRRSVQPAMHVLAAVAQRATRPVKLLREIEADLFERSESAEVPDVGRNLRERSRGPGRTTTLRATRSGVLRRSCRGCSGPRVCVPCGIVSSPRRRPARQRGLGGHGGTSLATGLPCLVIVNSSRLARTARAGGKWVFASNEPTVSISSPPSPVFNQLKPVESGLTDISTLLFIHACTNTGYDHPAASLQILFTDLICWIVLQGVSNGFELATTTPEHSARDRAKLSTGGTE